MGKVPQPTIIWRGAHPNNFTVGRPGAGRDGRNTNHHVVGSAESAVLVFNNPTRGASSHYVITDQPGVIFQCVDLNNTAWCDGNWESNLRTISMEHHGDWRFGFDNPTVRENSAMLVAWLRDQGLVNRPIRHRDVSTKGTICPADFPVEAVWNRATDIINSYNKPAEQPEWMKNRKEVSVRTLFNQKEVTWIHNLNAPGNPLDDRRFARNQDFYIKGETHAGGIDYWITASSFDANLPAGIAKYDLAETPWTPPVVVEPPKPETPKWEDSVIDDANQTMYVLRATQLINLASGRPATDKTGKEIWYQAGDIVENVSAHAIVANVTYQLTEYSFGQIGAGKPALANGIKSSDLTLDPKACPPGTPANPNPAPEPEDPVEPMPDVPTDYDKEQDAKINGIMDLLKVIGDAISAFLAKFKK